MAIEKFQSFSDMIRTYCTAPEYWLRNDEKFFRYCTVELGKKPAQSRSKVKIKMKIPLRQPSP
jgi:hypothetical protein